MKHSLFLFILVASTSLVACSSPSASSPIDRHALLQRNSPHITSLDSLSSLTVGNGHFAYTVDATGLQTFPEAYSHGVPLGTMSDWGWHSFANTKGFRFSETLVEKDFERGHKELYASQVSKAEEAAARRAGGAALQAVMRRKEAINFFRQNPHRLHLGTVGLYLPEGTDQSAVTDISQTLDLETGIITSSYKLAGSPMTVRTCAHPELSMIAVQIDAESPRPIVIRMPYPTGGHSDDACLWTDDPALHTTVCRQVDEGEEGAHFEVEHRFPQVEVYDEFDQATLHDYSYTLSIDLDSCRASIRQIGPNRVLLTPTTGRFAFTCLWQGKEQGSNAPNKEGSNVLAKVREKVLAKNLVSAKEGSKVSAKEGSNASNKEGSNEALAKEGSEASARGNTALNLEAATAYWHNYWYKGGIVDFSHCKASEAKELERRVVLSQYLLAVNCAGNTPPQETGLTYNSWFGKFHLEMIWWHQAQFALYGHPELLERSLQWYDSVEPVARQIARRQGFEGVRWMKMTDPSGLEAPSSTGSFLIWQQPHYIYLAELVRRAHLADHTDAAVEERYYDLVRETAEFMADFADYDTLPNRYILRGAIPAQETLKASTTINPPFELSQWHFALGVANQWRQRREGMKDMLWDELRDKLSPLHYITDSIYSPKYGDLYTASEDSEDTFRDIRLTSDHMAVLGALGIFPKSPLVREDIMRNTLRWVWDNWNWGKTWGWDYPMTAMCAVRLGEPQMAVNVLLGSQRTNTYLVSGHNYQDSRLRLYLPGNGGLLTAVALMCAGWDNCQLGPNPGWPKDGNWDVRWEGILPLP